jgi:integrase
LTCALTSVISYSLDHQRISSNPSLGFKMMKEVRDGISFWEKNEASNFLRFTNAKYTDASRWKYVVYLLALNTGLRAGELWGLKLKDINWDRKLINIQRQFNRTSKKLGPTKGKDSRKVPCNDDLLKELRLICESLDLDDFIFTNTKGTPICHNNFRSRIFALDNIESKVRKIRFHDLRHTALTIMVDSGVNIKTVQFIAGHKDITTTMKYVHLLGDSLTDVTKSFQINP